MTLSTRAELVAAIEDRLNSAEAAPFVGQFIRAAEAEMNRKIRARRRIIRATSTVDAEFVTVPTDFGGARTMRLTEGVRPHVTFIAEAQMAGLKDTAEPRTGAPQFYAVVGGSFEFFPAPDGDYEVSLSYYQKLPALTADSDTNWMLADHPDAYLAGAMAHGYAFLGNAEAAVLWKGQFEAALAEINAASLVESMGDAMTVSPNTIVV